MQISMGLRWRHWAICALIVALSAAGAKLSEQFRFFRLLHLKVRDFHYVVRGAQPVTNVFLVIADQKAIDTFTEPTLFWNPHYADAIRAAGDGGAKVMGLDLAFGVQVDRWQSGADQVLAEAVATAPMPVIMAYAPELNTNQVASPVPVNLLAAALDLHGFPNITADEDDSIRYQELMEAPDPKAAPGTPAERSLALRIAEKYVGADAEIHDGHILLRGKEVPMTRDRTMAIDFAGPPGTFPHASLADFVDAWKRGDKKQLHDWVDGKVVLMGTDSKSDRFDTPFFALGEKWTTPGVEIHGNTVRTLIEGRFLRTVPAWVDWLALAAVTILAVFVILSSNTTLTTLWLTLEAAAVTVATHMAFLAGWDLSASVLLLSMALCGVGAGLYRFWRGGLFRKAVSVFVGHQVASSLDTAGEISRSGESLKVTVLFSDIRGFTAYTEQVSQDPKQGPDVVVKVLNEYLSMMVSLIVGHGGHVNKFIGDGILAIFSDKDEDAQPGDHAKRAVLCGIDMVTAVSQFNTGVALHTGVAVVGNIGSKEKMEFTVLGDTVNLASRLENLNKDMHTRLLLSEETRAEIGGEIETILLGERSVRGKAEPVPLYTVASLVPAGTEQTQIHA
jgi:adenylate cyclase